MGGKEEYNLVSFPAKTGDMTAMHRETTHGFLPVIHELIISRLSFLNHNYHTVNYSI